MSILNLDMAAFKEACEDIRETWSFYSDEERANWLRIQGSYIGWFRTEIQDRRDDFVIAAEDADQAPDPRSFDSIKAELGTAALAAGFQGASRAQVMLIAKLAFDADVTGPILTSGRLDSITASRLIEEFKKDA
jgi:hypothetical protein